MRTYNKDITYLEPHQIFVFGSNTEGRHGKGAALTAKIKFGAINGQPRGLQGQSYAIITKCLRSKVHPSRTDNEIKLEINNLYNFALDNKDLEFYVAYHGKSKLLNNYNINDFAKLFAFDVIPNNIIFQKDFALLIHEARTPSLF